MNEKQSISFLILGFIIVLFILLVFFVSLILIFAKRLKEKRLQSIDSMFKGAENEKQKISRDLHDHIVPSIAEINFSLDAISSEDEFNKSKADLRLKINAVLGEIRDVSHDLVSHALQRYGLSEAIREYLYKSPINGIIVDVDDNAADKNIKPDIAQHLYAIFKELHQNSLKHSNGDQVQITLELNDDCLKFIYDDNGTFDKQKLTEGLGIKNIKSRAEVIKGKYFLRDSNNFHLELLIDNAKYYE